MALHYLHLNEGDVLPKLKFGKPYKCVVIINKKVSVDYQSQISEWLIDTGCLYMMAWGIECSTWDDSVDWAHIEKNEFEENPDSNFVMTTWHEKESLEEVFWFCEFCAHTDDDHTFQSTLILDIGFSSREKEILKSYEDARDRDD